MHAQKLHQVLRAFHLLLWCSLHSFSQPRPPNITPPPPTPSSICGFHSTGCRPPPASSLFVPQHLQLLSLLTTAKDAAPVMWPATFPLCFMLCGVWISASEVQAALPPNLIMTQMVQMFQDFMRQFNKTYESQEETHRRFKVFMRNLEVSHVLQVSELGTAQYGITRFSDLTEHEFAKMYGMSLPSPAPPVKQLSYPNLGNIANKSISQSCDWRKAGAVSAVKDQGPDCRSCWAFATVSNIEALWNIHQHVPRNLSVQEVIDCAYKKTGCQGGFVWDGLLAVFKNRGLSSSVLYPYVGRNQPCQEHRRKKVTPIYGYEVLPRDEKYIAGIVASQGPVTALFNMKVLQNYKKGILRRPSQDCRPDHLDHVGVIVGFNEVKSRRGSWTGPYWIIQNSWGEHWGEQGYFRLHRGTNTCGIAMYAVTATVKDSERKKPVLCPAA
ncbi:cathepsin W [Sceloporus undulatus]|uniref:cathepsin W n=1 Tax=Sceloporus undulatus TaxID=8520 RepID=UPI001C4C3478|nr:cathepsin W [Sceloporus undulatus]